jgi:hypothetical protein
MLDTSKAENEIGFKTKTIFENGLKKQSIGIKMLDST